MSIVILIFGHAVLSQNQMTYQRMAECWSGFKGARLSLEVESPLKFLIFQMLISLQA